MLFVLRQLSPDVPFFEGILDGSRIVSRIDYIVKYFDIAVIHSFQGINKVIMLIIVQN